MLCTVVLFYILLALLLLCYLLAAFLGYHRRYGTSNQDHEDRAVKHRFVQ